MQRQTVLVLLLCFSCSTQAQYGVKLGREIDTRVECIQAGKGALNSRHASVFTSKQEAEQLRFLQGCQTGRCGESGCARKIGRDLTKASEKKSEERTNVEDFDCVQGAGLTGGETRGVTEELQKASALVFDKKSSEECAALFAVFSQFEHEPGGSLWNADHSQAEAPTENNTSSPNLTSTDALMWLFFCAISHAFIAKCQTRLSGLQRPLLPPKDRRWNCKGGARLHFTVIVLAATTLGPVASALMTCPQHSAVRTFTERCESIDVEHPSCSVKIEVGGEHDIEVTVRVESADGSGVGSDIATVVFGSDGDPPTNLTAPRRSGRDSSQHSHSSTGRGGSWSGSAGHDSGRHLSAGSAHDHADYDYDYDYDYGKPYPNSAGSTDYSRSSHNGGHQYSSLHSSGYSGYGLLRSFGSRSGDSEHIIRDSDNTYDYPYDNTLDYDYEGYGYGYGYADPEMPACGNFVSVVDQLSVQPALVQGEWRVDVTVSGRANAGPPLCGRTLLVVVEWQLVATSLELCTCNAGFSGPNGGPCIACEPGTYKDAAGSAACSVCGSETYQLQAAATSCVPCWELPNPRCWNGTDEIVVVDSDGRRRFLTSAVQLSMPAQPPDCAQPATSNIVGCVSLPRTVTRNLKPNWAGAIHFTHPSCLLVEGARKCRTDHPLPARAAAGTTPTLSQPSDMLALHTLPSRSMLGSSRPVAVGDVNGDGRLDIVVGSYLGGNEVLLGDGNGRFEILELPGPSRWTTALALGDMNGDGHLDIVVGRREDTNQLLLGNGQGAYDVALDLPGGTFATSSVAVGDINGDGRLDIVIGNEDIMIPNQILLGDGNGGFGSGNDLGGSYWSMAVALGDLNGDGWLDIVVANREQCNSVFFGNNATGFDEVKLPYRCWVNTDALALGDVNDDGYLDVVFGNLDHANNLVLGDGRGGFKEHELPGPALNAVSVALGDVNGDGLLDVIAGNGGNPFVSGEVGESNHVLFGDGLGRFTEPVDLPGGNERTKSVALGDMNGDGRVDIVLGDQRQGTLLLLGRSSVGFEEALDLTDRTSDTVSAALGDVNGDGHVDIVLATQSDDARILHGDGRGKFHHAADLQFSSSEIVLCDLNKDGLLDIVCTGSPDKLLLLLADGEGGFRRQVELPDRSAVTTLAAGDVDGDGWPDVVVGTYGGCNQLLLGDGAGNFADAIDLTCGDSTMAVALGDMNGDGWLDIVIANWQYGHHVLLGDGKFGFEERDLPGGSEWMYCRSLAVGDVNGDGRLDIVLGRSEVANQLLLGDGYGGYSEAIDLPGGYKGTESVALGDVDGDGWVDILLGHYEGGNQLLLGDGAGGFVVVALPDGSSRTSVVALGDVNSDGRLDMFFGNQWFVDRLLIGRVCASGSQLHAGSWCLSCPEHMGLVPGGSCVECMPDHMQQQGEGELCASASCPLGRRLLGDDACTRCADLPGTYYNTTLQRRESEPGSWAQPQCTPCSPGSFASGAVPALDACYACPAGEHQPASGGSVCVACVPGSFQAARGQAACEPCPPGGFCAAADACGGGFVACPAGSFNPLNGSSSSADCQLCRPGTYSPVTAATTPDVCVPCRPGTYANASGRDECAECEAGEYQDERGATGCKVCVNGRYCPPGASSPLPCPPGTHIDPRIVMTSEQDCIACPAGTSCPTGSDQPTPCDPGTYSPEQRAGFCQRCAPGSFQDATGATACAACPSGSYCREGSSAPQACPAGTRANMSGAMPSRDHCIPCSPGTFCPVGSEQGTPCAAGTFSDGPAAECAPCAAGTSSGQGQTVCTHCVAGTYAASPGQSQCIPCPHPLSSPAGSTDCTRCLAGFFLLNASATPQDLLSQPDRYCQRCPRHADCSQHATLATLSVPPHFWRDSLRTVEIHPCRVHATTGFSPCVGSDAARRAGRDGDGMYCAAGHRGPRCEVCSSSGHYFDEATARCERCAASGRLWTLLGTALAAAAVAGGVAKVASKTSVVQQHGQRLRLLALSLSLQVKWKITLSFFQVVSTMEAVYGVRLHPDFSAWRDMLRTVSSDPSDLAYPAPCSFSDAWGLSAMAQRLLALGVLPWLLLLFLPAAIALHAMVTRAKGSDAAAARPLSQVVLGRTIHAALFFLYLVLPAVSSSIFQTRRCESFGFDDSAEGEASRRSYLAADMQVQCSDPTGQGEDAAYRALGPYFWSLFVLWPVAVPLGYLAVLRMVAGAVRGGQISPLAEAVRFLWRDFQPEFLFWEVIDTLRKLALTAFILLVQTDDGSSKLLRPVLASLLSVLYLAVLAVVRPYRRTDDLYIALVSNMLLGCVFVSGCIIKLCDPSAPWVDSCQTFVGFDSDFHLTLIIIILILAMVAVALLAIIAKVMVAAAQPTIKVVATRREPVLELPDGCREHIFLSYAWGTGYDQADNVTRRLQLLLPNLRISLDADRLQVDEELERAVSRAAVVVVFLSRGFFRSAHCRRELLAAHACQKPIVAVREVDPAKGGATVEELVAECLAHCCEQPSPGSSPQDGGSAEVAQRVFSAEPVEWAHVDELQLESLRLVTMRVLNHLPHYLQNPAELALGLRLPGELGAVGLPSAATLLVCGSNSGAANVAQELQVAATEGSEAARLEVGTAQGMGAGGGGEQALLVYLNDQAFADSGELAAAVARAVEDGVQLVLVHEQDGGRGGCEFERFLETAPRKLQLPPYSLFDHWAVPLYASAEHRRVGLRMVLRGMGAVPVAAAHSAAQPGQPEQPTSWNAELCLALHKAAAPGSTKQRAESAEEHPVLESSAQANSLGGEPVVVCALPRDQLFPRTQGGDSTETAAATLRTQRSAQPAQSRHQTLPATKLTPAPVEFWV